MIEDKTEPEVEEDEELVDETDEDVAKVPGVANRQLMPIERVWG